MRRLLAVLVAGPLAMAPAPASAAPAAWERWTPVSGIFDVDGPRTDGSLRGHLALTRGPAPPSPAAPAPAVTPSGGFSPQLTAFAGEWGLPTIAFLLLVALVRAVGTQAAVRRRRR